MFVGKEKREREREKEKKKVKRGVVRMEGQRCVEPRPFYTQRLRRPRGIVLVRGGAHLHLRGGDAEDLRVLLFPPRLTPAPGTIGDTLNSRRALQQEDGFREKEEKEEERLQNARERERERERERRGKGTAFSTVKEKKERFFFSILVVGRKQWPQSVYFSSAHVHTVSLLFSTKRETYSPSGDYKPSPFSRPTLALVPCPSVFAPRETEKERQRLAFHREKTPDQRVSRFVNRSTRCNSAA